MNFLDHIWQKQVFVLVDKLDTSNTWSNCTYIVLNIFTIVNT